MLNKIKQPTLMQNPSAGNRLAAETSPYLLQHAANPVHWHPWGHAAFAQAQAENKLVLISIGYSACHWCHVMEREVFARADVAEIMNQHYVCIKVDREERPDVDQLYMDAVQIITRRGGWPLNCFALPDGRPVYGGTYFTREAWVDVLHSLNQTWQLQPARITEVADELTQSVQRNEWVAHRAEDQHLTAGFLDGYVGRWAEGFDERYGGSRGGPKFPMPPALSFLLAYGASQHAPPRVIAHVERTLNRLAWGGIYDHLGGGFFRYSVDERWEVPHFEKMLYDNAQLIGLYAKAYRLLGHPEYKDLVYQCVDFLNGPLRAPDGGYYSAIDADSQGEEGLYYTWSKAEIDSLLGPDAELLAMAYGVTAAGSLRGRNVLRRALTNAQLGCILNLSDTAVEQKLHRARGILSSARSWRMAPAIDDKRLLAWNALAVVGLAEAHITFRNPQFLSSAYQCVQFIEATLIDGSGILHRVHCKGRTSVLGFLDDHAFLLQAYLALYQADHQEGWLLKAKGLADITMRRFAHPPTGMLLYAQDGHSHLVARKMSLTDGVIPSSTATMANNLLTLSAYFDDMGMHRAALQMIANMKEQLHPAGPFASQWAMAYLHALQGPALAIASGASASNWLWEVSRSSLRPFTLTYMGGVESEIPLAQHAVGAEQIMVCMDGACQKPTQGVDKILERLNRGYGLHPS